MDDFISAVVTRLYVSKMSVAHHISFVSAHTHTETHLYIHSFIIRLLLLLFRYFSQLFNIYKREERDQRIESRRMCIWIVNVWVGGFDAPYCIWISVWTTFIDDICMNLWITMYLSGAIRSKLRHSIAWYSSVLFPYHMVFRRASFSSFFYVRLCLYVSPFSILWAACMCKCLGY